MVIEVAVINSLYLLVIASHQQARTPALERAVASARAGKISLAVMALDRKPSQAFNGHVEGGCLTGQHQSGSKYPNNWLESEIEIERKAGLDVSLRWVWAGEARGAINAYLTVAMPDMLIKDIHSEPTIRRSFLSALDWYLLRECCCPIQFVTRRSAHLPRRILVAVNLFRSHDAQLQMNDQLLYAASRLAILYSAELHVVYVYDWAAICLAAATIYGARPVESEFQEALKDGLEEALALLCEHHGIPGDQHHFLTGTSLSTLDAFARKTDSELLVIGAFPVRNEKKVIGSTAESILVHAPCDVLVVRAQRFVIKAFSAHDHGH